MWNKNFGKIRRLDVIFILIVLIKVILIRFFKGKLSALPPTFINEEEPKTYEGVNAFETIEMVQATNDSCIGDLKKLDPLAEDPKKSYHCCKKFRKL